MIRSDSESPAVERSLTGLRMHVELPEAIAALTGPKSVAPEATSSYSPSPNPGHPASSVTKCSFKPNWTSRGLTSTLLIVPNDESKVILGDPHCV